MQSVRQVRGLSPLSQVLLPQANEATLTDALSDPFPPGPTQLSA